MDWTGWEYSAVIWRTQYWARKGISDQLLKKSSLPWGYYYYDDDGITATTTWRDKKCCATVLFPCGFGTVASRFFSVTLKVLSQGNLRRRSLQGPRSATTGWFTNMTLSSGVLFICSSSLSDYKLEYYNTSSGISTALCVIALTYNNLFYSTPYNLTLNRPMSSIYGAPSKARNFNVCVYIWTYVWQHWKPSLCICCTMFQHYINAEWLSVSQLCVNTLPASKVTLISHES